jgi:hypothetical protein
LAGALLSARRIVAEMPDEYGTAAAAACCIERSVAGGWRSRAVRTADMRCGATRGVAHATSPPSYA